MIGTATVLVGSSLHAAELWARFLVTNWLWGSVVILAAGLGLSRIGTAGPRARHGLLLASLLIAALLPLLKAAVTPRTALPPPTLPTLVSVAGVRPVAAPGHALAAGPALAPRGLPLRSDPRPVQFWGLCIAALLAAGAGFRLTKLLHGLAVVAGWRRGATRLEHPATGAPGGPVLGVVDVWVSPAVPVPCAFGGNRPGILIPTDLASSMSAASIRHILLHEVAHLRRRDPLWLLIAGLAGAFLWWNPLAALAQSAIERAAEDICDEAVLAEGGDGTAYARTLLRVMEHARESGTDRVVCRFGLRHSDLHRRITTILAGGRRASHLAIGSTAALSLCIASSVLAVDLGSRPRTASPAPPARLARADPRRRPPRSLVARRPAQAVRLRRPGSRPVRELLATAAFPAPSSTNPPETVWIQLGDDAAQPAAPADRVPSESHVVVFLLDISSSMRGYHAAAVREILRQIEALPPGDLFNVMAFSSAVRAFAESPVTPGEDSLAGARAWLNGLTTEVGTDLELALGTALASAGVTAVVLITDGLPSSGARGPVELVSAVQRQNRWGARILPISPGPANVSEGEATLSAIAASSQGQLRGIRPEAPRVLGTEGGDRPISGAPDDRRESQ